MSQPPQKEVDKINQLLAQFRSSMHSVSGTAIGLISDNSTSGLSQLGQYMLARENLITQLTKENEELKKKTPQKK